MESDNKADFTYEEAKSKYSKIVLEHLAEAIAIAKATIEAEFTNDPDELQKQAWANAVATSLMALVGPTVAWADALHGVVDEGSTQLEALDNHNTEAFIALGNSLHAHLHPLIAADSHFDLGIKTAASAGMQVMNLLYQEPELPAPVLAEVLNSYAQNAITVACTYIYYTSFHAINHGILNKREPGQIVSRLSRAITEAALTEIAAINTEYRLSK